MTIQGDTIPDEFTDLVQWAKQMKDSRTKGSEPDEKAPDIAPHVQFYRGDKLVAIGFCRNVNRDEGLDLAHIGKRAFSADRIELLLDAHVADDAFYQKYGRLPDPHELANLCETEDACNIGLATDCVMAVRVRAEGITLINLPYHIDVRKTELDPREARRITGDDREMIQREGNRYTQVLKTCHWQDQKIIFINEADSGMMSGVVPSALREIMKQDSAEAEMAKAGVTADAFGLSEEEARLHVDIVGTRILAQLGFAVALATYSDEQREVIDRSMARAARVVLIDPETGETHAKDPDARPDLLDLELDITRKVLDERREKIHEDELAETERRRKAREAAGGLTDEDKTRYDDEHAEMVKKAKNA